MDNFDDLRAALVSRDELYVFDRTPALLAERDALAARVRELEWALREVEQEAHGIVQLWVQDGCDSGSAISDMQSIADMARAALGDAR